MSIPSQFFANPATLSPALQALFPDGVVVAELRGGGDPAALHPSEAQHVENAVVKRRREFSAGRLCARRALATLGILDFILCPAADRQPIWPPHIVGSISHTDDLCLAAVALKSTCRALGIDCEVIGHVTAELWPSLFTVREAAWLAALADGERAASAAAVFSAKEAYYKAQYPLTGEWLDFHDLEIELVGEGEDAGGHFRVRSTRPVAAAALAGEPVMGRYSSHDGIIVTGVAFG